jgi:biotin carboxylase
LYDAAPFQNSSYHIPKDDYISLTTTYVKMKILLSDASGLTSRQIATILSRQNHTVHVLSPPGHTLTKLTHHVSKIHTVPPFGASPYFWLSTALSVLKSEPFDVLIATQEQVAVLSAEHQQVEETGVKIAVPSFASMRKVMGKLDAVQTLRDAGLPQPESAVVLGTAAVKSCSHLIPGYLKTSIGTASLGVRKVETLEGLEEAIMAFEDEGVFKSPGEKLLLQKEVQGSLLMVCGVFREGELRAWHACVRVHEGPNGGASKKVSLPLHIVGEHLALLGQHLGWHGALSLDAILLDGKPYYIDINPRIVEPMNALLSGVDLVQALLDVSLDKESRAEHPKHGSEGVETHQLILALLRRAERGRLMVAIEFFKAVMRFESYAWSVEELTPLEGDWSSLVVVLGILLLLLLGGSWMADKWGRGAVKGYALSGEGWREICEREDAKTSNKNGG